MNFYDFVHVAFILIIGGLAWASLHGAPWAPTKKKDIAMICEQICLPNNATVYDLGSGDGRIVFELAKNSKVARAIGFELAWPLYLISLFRRMFLPREQRVKAEFFLANFNKANLETADLVFCFLMIKTMAKVGPKIMSSLKPGAVLVSAVFAVDGIEPSKTIKSPESNWIYHVYRK